jgi:hypothetical protein
MVAKKNIVPLPGMKPQPSNPQSLYWLSYLGSQNEANISKFGNTGRKVPASLIRYRKSKLNRITVLRKHWVEWDETKQVNPFPFSSKFNGNRKKGRGKGWERMKR